MWSSQHFVWQERISFAGKTFARFQRFATVLVVAEVGVALCADNDDGGENSGSFDLVNLKCMDKMLFEIVQSFFNIEKHRKLHKFAARILYLDYC